MTEQMRKARNQIDKEVFEKAGIPCPKCEGWKYWDLFSHKWCKPCKDEWYHKFGIGKILMDAFEENERGEAAMREFETGATRDDDAEKLDYAGFISFRALKRYAEYMHKHRTQADGKLRAADNWKNGIPAASYLSSGFRHAMDLGRLLEAGVEGKEIEDLVCAILFNYNGFLHELLAPTSTEHAHTIHVYEADGPIDKGDPVVATSEGKVRSARDAFEDKKIEEQQKAEYNGHTSVCAITPPVFDEYTQYPCPECAVDLKNYKVITNNKCPNCAYCLSNIPYFSDDAN